MFRILKRRPKKVETPPQSPQLSEQTNMPHIVKSFENELEEIAAKIANMGGLAERQLTKAMESVIRRDSELANVVIAGDKEIDAIEQEVEDLSIRLLALRQPMANDLREAISAIKITSDLERVGDFAKNISKRALVLNAGEPVKLSPGLSEIGRLALSQLHNVLDSYGRRDADLAIDVWSRDEQIDDLYNSIFRELLTYMMEDPRTIGLCTHLLFIAKNIERIGDHVTNIAETIHYVIVGERLTDERPKSDSTSSASLPEVTS